MKKFSKKRFLCQRLCGFCLVSIQNLIEMFRVQVPFNYVILVHDGNNIKMENRTTYKNECFLFEGSLKSEIFPQRNTVESIFFPSSETLLSGLRDQEDSYCLFSLLGIEMLVVFYVTWISLLDFVVGVYCFGRSLDVFCQVSFFFIEKKGLGSFVDGLNFG